METTKEGLIEMIIPKLVNSDDQRNFPTGTAELREALQSIEHGTLQVIWDNTSLDNLVTVESNVLAQPVERQMAIVDRVIDKAGHDDIVRCLDSKTTDKLDDAFEQGHFFCDRHECSLRDESAESFSLHRDEILETSGIDIEK